MKTTLGGTTAVFLLLVSLAVCPGGMPAQLNGRCFTGGGDVECLRLLDIARRMYDADSEFQTIGMIDICRFGRSSGFMPVSTWP